MERSLGIRILVDYILVIYLLRFQMKSWSTSVLSELIFWSLEKEITPWTIFQNTTSILSTPL